jgi:V-type H+-transporting ATPase subunit a
MGQENRMTWVAGIIPARMMQKFKVALHLATRGNVMTEYKHVSFESLANSGDIDAQFANKNTFIDPKTGQPIAKVLVFMVSLNRILDQTTGKTMAGEFKKIIDRFDMFCLELPKTPMDRDELLQTKRGELQDNLKILRATTDKCRDLIRGQLELCKTTGLSLIEEYELYKYREQMILQSRTYLTTDQEAGTLQKFYVWTPKRMEDELKVQLKDLNKTVNDLVEPVVTQIPEQNFNSCLKANTVIPTSFMENDLTSIFNEIVYTYSAAKYKEINPAIFTVTTFPFLFGVMFGDVGHGLILFVAGIFLCLKADALKKTGDAAMQKLAQMRYLLLFMGFFAIFCGIIYNEFFAVPIPWLNSCYHK